MEFTLKEGVVLRLSWTLTRYQNCIMKDHEYIKHSLKHCGKKDYRHSCVKIIVCSYVWSHCVTYQGQKAINSVKSVKQNGLRNWTYPNWSRLMQQEVIAAMCERRKDMIMLWLRNKQGTTWPIKQARHTVTNETNRAQCDQWNKQGTVWPKFGIKTLDSGRCHCSFS